MATISSCLHGYRILLALACCFCCYHSVSSVSADADVALPPVVTTAASADYPSTPDSALEETLNGLIKDEVAASKVVMEQLNTYPLDKRTIGLSLQLCMEQDPNLFCAWFTQSKQKQQQLRTSNSTSSVAAGSTSLIDVGAHRIHGLTCFSEKQRVCNQASTNKRATGGYRPRQTQCRPACAPCREVDCPSRSKCENVCYCTCNFIAGKNWTFDANATYYSCTDLCDDNVKCPNEADENSATCRGYPAREPPMQVQLAIFIFIGGVVVVLSLLFFVYPKLRRHCCRASAERGATAAPQAENAAAAFLPKA